MSDRRARRGVVSPSAEASLLRRTTLLRRKAETQPGSVLTIPRKMAVRSSKLGSFCQNARALNHLPFRSSSSTTLNV